MRMLFLTGSLLFLVNPVSLLAQQLKWDKTSLEFRPELSATNIVAKFPFRNTGDKPLTIRSVNSSCGCTTVDLPKKVYEPGEKGEIVANFVFGGREGEQNKGILVESDDPKAPYSNLELKVHIPKVFDVTPSYLSWMVGKESSPKVVSVRLPAELKIEAIDVKSSDDKLFKAELRFKKSTTAKEYEVLVTPLDTSRLGGGSIQIQVNPGLPGERVHHVFVYTQGPPPAPLIQDSSLQ
jgi:hypothetical protein